MVFKLSIRIFFILFLSFNLSAQNENILYLMDNVPSSKDVNISSYEDSIKFNFSLPLISSFYTDINSDLAFNDIIQKRSDNLNFLAVNSLLTSLNQNNNFNIKSKINLFRIGFKIKNSYLDLIINENFKFNLDINEDIFRFLINGNKSYSNQSIGSLNFNFNHYREVALAFTKKISLNDKYISIGVKPKYLIGLSNINLYNNFLYNSREDFSEIGIIVEGTGDISFPISINSNEINFDQITSNLKLDEYILNNNNNGFGFDFGLGFKSKKIKISTSVINIGRINWIENSRNLSYELGYNFNGFDISNSINKDDDNFIDFNDLINNKIDSIEITNSLTDNKKSFIENLKPRLFLNTSFIVSNKFEVGILFNSSFEKLIEDMNITIHSSLKFNDVFHLIASYDNNSKLGVGLSIKGGPLQLYLLTNNVIDTYNIFYPYKANKINLNMGINFVF